MKIVVLITTMLASALMATGAAGQTVPTVTPGLPVTGSLMGSDPLSSDGRFYRCYRLRTVAGQSYRMELSSAEFDTYLMIMDGSGCGGEAAMSNDDAVGTNSALSIAGDGTTKVIQVSSFESGSTGAYTLTARQFVSVRARAQDVGMGGRLTGVLDETDPLTNDGKFYELYSFNGRAGQQITIDLSSDAFDSYLVLGRQGASGFQAIQEDDDGQQNGLNSRISFTPAETGEYRFKIMGLTPGARGDFAIDIGPGPGFDYAAQAQAQADAEARQQQAYAQQQAQAQAQADYYARQEQERQQRIAECRARERAANEQRQGQAMGNLVGGLLGMAAGDNNYASQQFAQASQAQTVNYNCGG